MKKYFVDCGIREGDAIAAFLGDTTVGYGAYYQCLKARTDANEFELIGFESQDYKFLTQTRQRFAGKPLTLIEKLVWIFDGCVAFDSDGESQDCRLVQVANSHPHPNANAKVQQLPCVDLADYIAQSFLPEDYVIVKLDVEGAEYDILHHLIQTGALYRIKELYVEYHWWGNTGLRESIESTILQHPEIFYRNDWP